MRLYKFIPAMLVFALTSLACGEENSEIDESEKEKPLALEASFKIDGQKTYSFSLNEKEQDNVVFMDKLATFKIENTEGQILDVALAGPDIYGTKQNEFKALPNLPYEAEENLASISVYDPNEKPLTNDAKKIIVDGTVIVKKLTKNEIELSYSGKGFPGGNFANNTEGRFNVVLQLEYTGFELLDLRN